jgi:hypothetical protein
VNKQVKWSTNRQKLADYQSKVDLTAMEKSQHPIAQQFKVCVAYVQRLIQDFCCRWGWEIVMDGKCAEEFVSN